MRRKLAVVTAALTFITVCNLAIYSRRVANDQGPQSCSECNANTATNCTINLQCWSAIVGATEVPSSISWQNDTIHIKKNYLAPTSPSSSVLSSRSPTLNSTPTARTGNSSSIDLQHLCEKATSLMLLILVTSAVDHTAQRNAIRATWGGAASRMPDVRLAFIVGRPKDSAVQNRLDIESDTYKDLIQQLDFIDTYHNLSLKSLAALRWSTTNCPKASYLMKSDDDMFINVPNLLKYLRMARPVKNFLFGRLVRFARPLRSKTSKYYVPTSQYKDAIYPDYLSGTAYVMSMDVARKIYATARKVPLFVLEDVYITGICAKLASIPRRNHPGFVYYKRPVKGCAYSRVISGHDNTPSDMQRIWKELQRSGARC